MTCPTCLGTLWVCADHTTLPWGALTVAGWGCGAEGSACHCNPTGEMPPGTEEVEEVEPEMEEVFLPDCAEQ